MSAEPLRPDPHDEEAILLRARAELADADAATIVRWALGTFGDDLVVTSSFGAHSAVMLHLVSEQAPGTSVVFIDTGHLFPETYRFAHDLAERLDLDLRIYQPRMTAAHQEAIYGRLWEQGEESVQEYLRINKVEPLQRAFREIRPAAWLSGVRSEQTDHRGGLEVVDVQDGRVKIHPILRWRLSDVEAYMESRDLPYHPLYAEGYRSIGDVHSTLPTRPGQDPRDGRILGAKRECGIHLPLTEDENRSLTSSKL